MPRKLGAQVVIKFSQVSGILNTFPRLRECSVEPSSSQSFNPGSVLWVSQDVPPGKIAKQPNYVFTATHATDEFNILQLASTLPPESLAFQVELVFQVEVEADIKVVHMEPMVTGLHKSALFFRMVLSILSSAQEPPLYVQGD
ncbi:hypothetical protein BC827DRAFT_1159579 [Russula dissimulans]|nr:hypothetical protein BC827DRAFT_1159579 [Russula dissimulans]